jgi:hypothetical protein
MQKLDKLIDELPSENPKLQDQYNRFKKAKERLKLKIISLGRVCANSEDSEVNAVDLKPDF